MDTNTKPQAWWLGGLALLLAGHVQAADCAAEFAQDNRFKPEAGAYRMEDTTQVRMRMGEQWLQARTDRAVSEVVPPASLRLTNTAPMNTAEFVLLDGRKGWQKEDKDGAFEPMEAEVVKAFVKEVFSAYFNTDDMRALTCTEAQSPTGVALRVYQYQLPTTLGIKEVLVTASFDKAKRIPVSSTVSRLGPSVEMKTTTVVTFDRAIRITAPATGKQKLPAK